MERMQIVVEKIEIEGTGRNAVAHVVARPAPASADATVRVSVQLTLEPHATLAEIRRRAKDEALRYLDVE